MSSMLNRYRNIFLWSTCVGVVSFVGYQLLTKYKRIRSTDIKLKWNTHKCKSLPYPLHSHVTVYDGDNLIYILGGNDGKKYRKDCFKYDINENKYIQIDSYKKEACYHCAGLLSNGNIISFGGSPNPHLCIYDVNKNQWDYSLDYLIKKQSFGYGTQLFVQTINNKDLIHIIGGHFIEKKYFILDIQQQLLTEIKTCNLPQKKRYHNLFFDKNENNIYVIGGCCGKDDGMNCLKLNINHQSNKWINISSFNNVLTEFTQFSYGTCIEMSDQFNFLLLFGGYGYSKSNKNRPINCDHVLIYDTKKNEWSKCNDTQSKLKKRLRRMSVVRVRNRIHLIGGWDDDDVTKIHWVATVDCSQPSFFS